jgi:hypothetical protein
MKFKISSRVPISSIKFNYKCKAGTVDEGFSCPSNPEENKPTSEPVASVVHEVAVPKISNFPLPKDVDAALSNLKTTSEITDYANKAFPATHFKFDGMIEANPLQGRALAEHVECHPDFARATVSQFTKLNQEFPDTAKEISQIRLDDRGANAWASAGAESGGSMVIDANGITKNSTHRHIYLNPRYYSDPEKFQKTLKESVEKGFHPIGCDTPESVLTHEFGHCVYEHYKDANRQTLIPFVEKAGYASYGFGTVAGTVAAWGKEQNARGLSTYAKPTVKAWGQDTDRDERWAEAFASLHHTPEDKQVKIVKNMGKLLDRIKDESKWMPLAGATYPHTSYEMQSRTGPDEQDLKAAEAFKALRVDVGLKPEKAQRGKKR